MVMRACGIMRHMTPDQLIMIDYQLLLIAFVAATLKVCIPPYYGPIRTLASFMASMACAYLFADPILYILGGIWSFEPGGIRYLVIGLVGATGEYFVQHAIGIAKEPRKAPGAARGIRATLNAAIGRDNGAEEDKTDKGDQK